MDRPGGVFSRHRAAALLRFDLGRVRQFAGACFFVRLVVLGAMGASIWTPFIAAVIGVGLDNLVRPAAPRHVAELWYAKRFDLVLKLFASRVCDEFHSERHLLRDRQQSATLLTVAKKALELQRSTIPSVVSALVAF